MKEIRTGSASHKDEGKLRVDLLPPELEEGIAAILTYGCVKYEERNWEKGMLYMKMYASIRRHLLSWLKGEDADVESGFPHMWHIATDAMMIATWQERRFIQLDNRPVRMPK